MQSGNVAGVRIVPQFLGRKILMSSGRPLDPVSCECVWGWGGEVHTMYVRMCRDGRVRYVRVCRNGRGGI